MKAKGPGPVQVKAGQMIITDGEPGREMYIIEDGKVEIVRGAGEGQQSLGVLETGDFFGEMAILEDLPRSASARAVTDCKLLLIDHSTFDQMLRQYPEIAVRMLRKLSGRLREASVDPEGERPARAAAAPATPAASRPAVVPLGAQKPLASESAGSAAPPEKPSPEATKERSPESSLSSREKPGAGKEAAPRPTAPPGKLVATQSGSEFPLPHKSDIKLGRFDSVTGLHPDIDLAPIDTNRLTSRRHAKILREDDKVYLVEEIGTPNGTFVNDERIRAGVKVELKDGDRLLFADVAMTYRAR